MDRPDTMVIVEIASVYEVRNQNGTTMMRTHDPHTASDWCKENGLPYFRLEQKEKPVYTRPAS